MAVSVKKITSRRTWQGVRVLVRSDFNVPLKNGRVSDDYKIQRGIATLRYLSERGARVVVVTHLGRPKARFDAALSLKPVVRAFEKLTSQKVIFVPYQGEKSAVYWAKVEKKIAAMAPGNILFLDNIRFFKGEEEKPFTLAPKLAQLADCFVYDAFAVAHHAAASVSAVGVYMPTYAGLLMAEELAGLRQVLNRPKHPLVVVLGGIKLETKIPVLKRLLSVADYILIGGGLSNTLLSAQGKKVGCSVIDKKERTAMLCYGRKKKIIVPVDAVVGKIDGSGARVVALDTEIHFKNKEEGIYDIGPETVRLYAHYIKRAKMIVWNGAMGYFEKHPYEYGTVSLARLIASRAKGPAVGVCGGGETVEIIRSIGATEDIDLVSTGGGAMLEFLSGKKLPGVNLVTESHR